MRSSVALVSTLTSSVVGLPGASAFSCSVTPSIAPSIMLVVDVTSKPAMRTSASAAGRSVVQFEAAGGSCASTARPPSPPACVTVISFAAPVRAEVSTSRAPSSAVISVARMPVLSADALIASRMPASVACSSPISTSKLSPATDSVSVPVPTVAVAPSVKACEASCCAFAMRTTSTW